MGVPVVDAAAALPPSPPEVMGVPVALALASPSPDPVSASVSSVVCISELLSFSSIKPIQFPNAPQA
jgi:hypothetical protein